MKKVSLLSALSACLLLSLNLSAQTPESVNHVTGCRIASINSVELLELVPGKPEATAAIKELNRKYKDELLVMQNDYNKKYSDFISAQNTLAESIKLRRMQELHELEKSINAFIKVAQEDVESQEQQLIEPLRKKLQKAIEEVGQEENFACIYDLANPAIAFVTHSAIDANPLVQNKLEEK
ncbi:MAG: OmpH family outer membrane protein [Prevotella sp.]|jgi:outer membrane protein|nr:OmpH family outer membrane protein [Prevotella sp.]